MYRQIKDGSVLRLTRAPIVAGDPIDSITYDSEDRVTQIVYKVLTKSGLETVDVTYTPNGSPIFKGIIYLGASINIFQAEITPQVNTTIPTPAILDIEISDDTVFEGAVPGTVVGTLSIVGGTPPAAFAVTDDPNGLFETMGSDLVVKTDMIGNSGSYQIEVTAVDSNAEQFVKALNINILPYTSTLSTEFDGLTEYCTAPSNVAWGTDSRTVSFWAKWGAVGVPADSSIINKHKGGDGNIYFGWNVETLASNRVRVSIYQSGTIIKQYQISSALNPLDGEWHHFAWTFDFATKTLKIYMDGSEVIGTNLIKGRDDTFTGAINTNTWDLFVAVAHNSAGSKLFYFDGLLDEISIFDTALIGGDITDIYNSGVPGSLLQQTFTPNLVSWWRMGEMDVAPTIKDVEIVEDLTMVNMDDSNFVGDVPV